MKRTKTFMGLTAIALIGFSYGAYAQGTMQFPTKTSSVTTKNSSQEIFNLAITNIYKGSNQMQVVFLNEGTKTSNGGAEGVYYLGGKNIGLYSAANSGDYSIQYFNNHNQTRTVKVGLDIPMRNQYLFEAYDFESVDPSVSILLEDTKEGVIQDLRVKQTYSFSTLAGNQDGRFLLHFVPSSSGKTSLLNDDNGDNVKIFADAGQLHVKSNDMENGISSLEIYNLMGQKLDGINVNNSNDVVSLDTGYLEAGYYVAVVQSHTGEMKAKKIFITK